MIENENSEKEIEKVEDRKPRIKETLLASVRNRHVTILTHLSFYL